MHVICALGFKLTSRGCQDDPDEPAVIKREMMAVEEEEGEEEVAALLHNYLNMVEVRYLRTININLQKCVVEQKGIYSVFLYLL